MERLRSHAPCSTHHATKNDKVQRRLQTVLRMQAECPTCPAAVYVSDARVSSTEPVHRLMHTAHEVLPRAHQPALGEDVALAGDAALGDQGAAARRPAALEVPQRGRNLRIGHMPQRPPGRHALQHDRDLRPILLQ